VLRGPQGTLFGAGAEGGVVRFLAPDPNLHKTQAYAKADFAVVDGGDESYEGGVAFGMPIIDGKLAFRASVSYRRDGGWVDRVNYTLSPDAFELLPTPVYAGTTEPNANYQETTTARLALLWQVSDSLSIMPSVYYQHLEIHDTAAYWESLSNPSSNLYRNGNALRNPSDDPFTLAALRINWNLGAASLFSNTSYYDRNQKGTSDYSQYLRATYTAFEALPNTYPPPGAYGYAAFEDQQRNFYQELRLASNDTNARILWSGGLFYSHTNENVPENIVDPTLESEIYNYTGGFDICSPELPCPGGMIYYGPLNRVVDEQIAAFGELTYKVTDTFKATLGLRASHIKYTGSTYGTGPFLGTTLEGTTSATEKPVTPKVALAWQPDPDNLVYASASKGFRPGGVNVPVGEICGGDLASLGIAGAPNQYSSDSLWSYELGTKNTFMDHTLQLNASVYYVDWKNIQQNVYLPSCGEQFTGNLGQARSVGGDIELLFRPIPALTLDLTAAYTDAKLTKTSCGGDLAYDAATLSCTAPGATPARPIASDGDALPAAPWAFTASAEYHFAGWTDHQPYLRLDYQYTTAQTDKTAGQNVNNALFDTTLPGLPSIKNLSARLGLRFGGFDVSIYGNNLTNEHTKTFVSRDIAPAAGPPGTGDTQMGPVTDDLFFARGVHPLTIGVTGTYRY
jgi:outer membrane receptor protein involved in Fe transport